MCYNKRSKILNLGKNTAKRKEVQDGWVVASIEVAKTVCQVSNLHHMPKIALTCPRIEFLQLLINGARVCLNKRVSTCFHCVSTFA